MLERPGTPERRYATLKSAVVADIGRAIAMATCGVLAFAPVEYVLTTWTYAGPIPAVRWLRLVLLVATLAAFLWVLLVVPLVAAIAGARLVKHAIDPARALGRGWFDASAVEPSTGIRRGVPLVWAAVATGLVVGFALQRVVVSVNENHKEPQLVGALIAAYGLGAIVVAAAVFPVFAAGARVAARALAPLAGTFNPLGRWRAAGATLTAAIAGGLVVAWYVVPQSRSEIPMRMVISAMVIGLAAGFGSRMTWRRPHKETARIFAAAACVVLTGTLWAWGADPGTKYVAVTASPALDRLVSFVRYANDVDGDGYGSLLGENDCAPFDSSINPGAVDIPDNGIDEDCSGTDYSLHDAVEAPGVKVALPDKFAARAPWNVLFITIDTVRYDRTSFGGYRDGPKKRDTTPNLANLVSKSTSFVFTNAPSAGTMASIPAIITSKYFHSGIALDENVPHGMPPRLKPENTTLPEIMKRGGYTTGVIGSHEYWNDWGMEQGVDDYDNSIGKASGPYSSPADQVTDHALAWISRHQGTKWFLWAHYIDPHGYYVAHPNVVDYGTSQSDLYDAELKWTDQELGKLLDELVRLPSHDHTIIVITSDHGDSMAEHNVPLGTHGTALYRELQHVPMIFYIPDNAPHQIRGAVSNLDIVPTLAELCQIDVHDLSFEGHSLVGSLFHGTEYRDRIVFAETNLPNDNRSRAAISETWKLIYYINSNIYELFDLRTDPWEHTNVAPQNPPELVNMKKVMSQWLERVTYARDPVFNQTETQIKDVRLGGPPTPEVATTGQALDDGAIEILGIGPAAGATIAPGAKLDLHVYFKVVRPSEHDYKFLLSMWPVDTSRYKPTDTTPLQIIRSPSRATANGFFGSNHWRAGDYIRERFSLQIPPGWTGDGVALGLVAADQTGKVKAPGAAPANDPHTLVLGVLPMGSQAPHHP